MKRLDTLIGVVVSMFFAASLVALVLILILCAVDLITSATASATDTDLSKDVRSGLVLRTDYGTGCQYVGSPGGGAITPRLGPDGKPICVGARR